MPTPSQWPSIGDGLAFGGDYTPEQWDESVWERDVALMGEAGVTLVTVGVFAWALLEPEPGRFDFAWLDRVLDLLHGAGIAVDLATPTAAPPAWLLHKHPEILPVTREGTRLGPGARESFCPSAPAYRSAATAIAAAMAEHYAHHRALTLWHVNNEYGAHVDACYCETSAQDFRDWLLTTYGTLALLNEAWGTAVWGQTYSAWEQVEPPRAAPLPVNPAQALDFRRFSSDAFLACYLDERAAIRRFSDVPVTTNFMTTNCSTQDYWRWAREVDVVSNDHYLSPSDPRPHVELALGADLTRGLAHGGPWLLMEHSTGAVNWQSRNIAKTPGQMRVNTFAHLARGADGALFFQWRASRSGAEKFHSAMLPHAGTESATWRELTQLSRDIAAVGEVRGSRVAADVAVVWDWEAWWALDQPFRPTEDLRYPDAVRRCYDVLWDHDLTVDFVPPDATLDGYRLVVVPGLYLCDAGLGERLARYTRDGGTLLVTYFSGIVDRHDSVHPGPHPGALRDVLGLTVEEFHPLHLGVRVDVDGLGAGDVWSERITLKGAERRACFTSGPDTGAPAVTVHRLGRGQAWYVGTRFGRDDFGALLREVLDDAGWTPVPSPAPTVERVTRVADDAEYVFLLNHDADAPAKVSIEGDELTSGQAVMGELELAPNGLAVVRRPIRGVRPGTGSGRHRADGAAPSSPPSGSEEGGG